jgi:hypothetical protein
MKFHTCGKNWGAWREKFIADGNDGETQNEGTTLRSSDKGYKECTRLLGGSRSRKEMKRTRTGQWKNDF